LIKEVFIIGSITGYKYSETSDIDVNVRLSDLSAFYHDKKDILNGDIAEGTRRPINYFIVEEDLQKPSTIETWADYKFGVYNVLTDQWLKEPPSHLTVRDPQEQFRDELITAKLVAAKFNREADEYLKDMIDYKTLLSLGDKTEMHKARTKRKLLEVEDDLKDLIQQAKQVKEDRKSVYRLGFGIPRESFDNIVFKMIEHGIHGKLFEQLKSVGPDESKKILLHAISRNGEKQ
tara:strand:- start:11196 stop:11894 length:699 start_codon:yes stop_codon:yes gene_type:complete